VSQTGVMMLSILATSAGGVRGMGHESKDGVGLDLKGVERRGIESLQKSSPAQWAAARPPLKLLVMRQSGSVVGRWQTSCIGWGRRTPCAPGSAHLRPPSPNYVPVEGQSALTRLAFSFVHPPSRVLHVGVCASTLSRPL